MLIFLFFRMCPRAPIRVSVRRSVGHAFSSTDLVFFFFSLSFYIRPHVSIRFLAFPPYVRPFIRHAFVKKTWYYVFFPRSTPVNRLKRVPWTYL